METLPKGQLKRRLQGLETEYGVGYTIQGDSAHLPKNLADILAVQIVENVGKIFGLPYANLSYFPQNGALCYLDTGYHPEYSTPECESIRNVVHADLAGEQLLERSVRIIEKRMIEAGRPIKISLYKNNTDSRGESWGCHENYTAKRDVKFMVYANALIPFFVTRQIFSGAGRVVSVGKRKIKYHIGARSFYLVQDISGATTEMRAIINTRDEPHADAEKYRRLHVIVGDSNMAPVPNYLKLGTTAMVLSLIEEGIIDDAFVRKVSLANPVLAIRQVAEDMTCKRTDLKGLEGMLSALGIQRAYFDLALRHRDLFADQYKPILDKWGRLLDTLGRDPMEADVDVDWVTKWIIIDNYLGRNGGKDMYQAAGIDLKYHNIITDRGIFRGKINEAEKPFSIDQMLVQRLVDYPPDEERARIRGSYARLMQALGYEYKVEWRADWPILVSKIMDNRKVGFLKQIHGNNIGKLKGFFLEMVPPEKQNNPEVMKILQEAFPN